MSMMRLSELAAMLNAPLNGADEVFDGVSTDTRTLAPGDLFVALQGPNFDGHDYLDVARQQGAAGALVSRPGVQQLPSVEVEDTLQALGVLGRGWRGRCPATVIGITGSNGKTTLKEMTTAILGCRGPVLSTRGNLNNHIGVPLTLLRMREEPYAVIEMGANHAGEIDYLTRLARPDVAVLNNAGRAHLEGFGSVEGVAHAKAEIINGLAASGTFVFNADDAYADLWRDLSVHLAQRTFGVVKPADVFSPADSYETVWTEHGFHVRFRLHCDQGETAIDYRLAGEHNRLNALAAAAASLAAGATLDDVREGLAKLSPVAGRLCPLQGVGGARLIDDSYNANPDSVAAALRVLSGAPGRRTFVLGDLAELGGQAEALHREIGEQAAAEGIDRLFTVGGLSGHAGAGFGSGHRHFDSLDRLVDSLQAELDANDSVLIKGSRSAGMDRVVRDLQAGDVAC
jgi:UDP-N-acetylmuramoyl-tripeptide--D-alanyl-D-alanine ligase